MSKPNQDSVGLLQAAWTAARSVATWSLVGADTIALGSLVPPLALLPDRGHAAHRVAQLWSSLNLAILRSRVRVRQLGSIDPDRPYVVMANHLSWIDVFAVISRLPLQIRWVMKRELRRLPVFGYACEKMGQIYVTRGDSEDARASLQAAADRIAEGTSVVFFPEGTRSRDARLARFKTGGFRLALQAQVPILPVTLWGTQHVLAPDDWRLRRASIDMTVAEPIETAGLTADDDLEDLMARVRGVMAALLPAEAREP